MARCKTCGGKFKVKWLGQKTCSKSCQREYLKENPPKQINKVSAKRQIQEDVYYKVIRPNYLKDNPWCVRCTDNNIKTPADQIHHKNGREGERLNDTDFFQSSCDECHKWIHANPMEAREKGYLI